ncbi:hypothetical protein Anas_09048 [Armadillidium nasatum]|uniref:Uncharacterized protein n=1 Tax=Armadillidium nasatum TaxID=96803 RepID=A0A5N5T722_9CRUS|nr:hypothetical protein Anas_09048 [Armadillidium nasatum]
MYFSILSFWFLILYINSIYGSEINGGIDKVVKAMFETLKSMEVHGKPSIEHRKFLHTKISALRKEMDEKGGRWLNVRNPQKKAQQNPETKDSESDDYWDEFLKGAKGIKKLAENAAKSNPCCEDPLSGCCKENSQKNVDVKKFAMLMGRKTAGPFFGVSAKEPEYPNLEERENRKVAENKVETTIEPSYSAEIKMEKSSAEMKTEESLANLKINV